MGHKVKAESNLQHLVQGQGYVCAVEFDSVIGSRSHCQTQLGRLNNKINLLELITGSLEIKSLYIIFFLINVSLQYNKTFINKNYRTIFF